MSRRIAGESGEGRILPAGRQECLIAVLVVAVIVVAFIVVAFIVMAFIVMAFMVVRWVFSF